MRHAARDLLRNVRRERTMQTKLVSLRHVEQLCVSMIAGSVIFRRHPKQVSGDYSNRPESTYLESLIATCPVFGKRLSVKIHRYVSSRNWNVWSLTSFTSLFTELREQRKPSAHDLIASHATLGHVSSSMADKTNEFSVWFVRFDFWYRFTIVC